MNYTNSHLYSPSTHFSDHRPQYKRTCAQQNSKHNFSLHFFENYDCNQSSSLASTSTCSQILPQPTHSPNVTASHFLIAILGYYTRLSAERLSVCTEFAITESSSSYYKPAHLNDATTSRATSLDVDDHLNSSEFSM